MEKIASVSNDASSVFDDSKTSSTCYSSSDLVLNSAVSAAYDGGKSVGAKNDGDGDGDGSALPSNCSNKLVNVNITSKTELNNYTSLLQLQSSSSSTQENDRIFVGGGDGDKSENVNADVSIITADEGQKSKADLISGEQQQLKTTMEVAAGGDDEKESFKTENLNELSLAEKNPPLRSRPHPPPLKSLPLLKIDRDANLAVMERDISTSRSSSSSGNSQPRLLDRPGELKNRFDSGFSHFPPVTTTTTTTTLGSNRRNIRRQSLPSTLPPLPPASSSIGLPQSSPLASPPGPRDGDHPHHRHHHHHHHLHHPLSHNKPTFVASNPLQKSLEKNLLIASRAAYGSLNSDVSAASSSVSSVESLLEIRRENPEEILMALGFGGSGGGGCGGYGNGLLVDPGNVLLMDPLLRIPGRFFEQPSSARGIDVQDLFTGRRGGLGGSGVGGGRMSPLSVLGSQSTAPGHHHHHHNQGDTRVFHFPQRMIFFFRSIA